MEIGGYRTEELIGSGGAAQVWRAVAPDGQTVALKVFSGPYDQALEAAKREAALATRIDHPHLAAIRAVVCDHDVVAMAVRWAAGGSLASVLRHRGTLTPGETLTVLIPIASALATAHERGVVHGDLSPGNIVFAADGRPLLVDLGAAGIGVECGLSVSATPGYVAPEVARHCLPDPAADVFALGAVALHCLTGKPAWRADDLRDVVVQATVGQWPDLPDDAGPEPLVRLIRSMVGDVPTARPGAATVALELARCGTPEPVALPAAQAIRRGRHAAAESADAELRPAADRSGGVDFPLTATRRRADTPAPVSEEPPRRRRRVSMRAVGLAVVAVVIGGLAVQSGLLWGAASAPAGSSAPPAAGSSGAAPTSMTPGTPTGTANRPTSGEMTSGVMTSEAMTSRAKTPGETSPGAPAAGSPKSGSSVPEATAGGSTAPAGGSSTDPSPTAVSPTESSRTASDAAKSRWASVIRALDAERSTALTTLDTERLAQVYTDGCAARAADERTITSLAGQRLRVDGAAHRITRVQVLPADRRDGTDGARTVTLVVTDSLPSYRLLAADGTEVGRTTARAEATRTILLAATDNGYRIDAIHHT